MVAFYNGVRSHEDGYVDEAVSDEDDDENCDVLGEKYRYRLKLSAKGESHTTPGLFFQHFLPNSRSNKLKDFAKLKDFLPNSRIFFLGNNKKFNF